MLRKVKAFFHLFFGSFIPQSSFYHKILNKQLGSAIQYFIVVSLVLYFLFIGFITLRFQPHTVYKEFKHSIIDMFSHYPNHTVISISRGMLSMNDDRPLFVWLTFSGQQKLIAVVDQTSSDAKIVMYNTPLLFTAKNIVVQLNKQVFTMSYATTETQIIVDKTLVDELTRKVMMALSYFEPFFIFFLIFVLPWVVSLMYSIHIVTVSGLVYFILKFKQKNLSYVQILKLSLYAITLPLVLNYMLGTVFLTIELIAVFPFVFFTLYFVFVFTAVCETHLNHFTSRPLHVNHQTK